MHPDDPVRQHRLTKIKVSRFRWWHPIAALYVRLATAMTLPLVLGLLWEIVSFGDFAVPRLLWGAISGSAG